jgi:hypothetical protein
MFAIPECKTMESQSENLLELLDQDELESVENEIKADLTTQSILKTRDSDQFNSKTLESYPDEEKTLSKWFKQEIEIIVKFRVFKFFTIENEKILKLMDSAEEKLIELYGKDVFSYSEDTETECMQIGK